MAKKISKKVRIPRMLRHSSGQARVILNGKVHYLGVYDSPEAHARYSRIIREWQETGRRPLAKAVTVEEHQFTVSDLFIRYRKKLTNKIEWGIQFNARNLYRKNGDDDIPVTFNPDGRLAPGDADFSTACVARTVFEIQDH